jgi:hypothetical protein
VSLNIRASQDEFSIYSGGYRLGGGGIHTLGPKPFWAWQVKIAQASGAAATAQEAEKHIVTSWQAWLAKAQLPAQSNPATLRVTFAAHEGVATAHPDSDYLLLSGELIVGTLRQDPMRHITNPRIQKPKTAPWYWMLGHAFHLHGYGYVGGSGHTQDHVVAMAFVAWNRWLDFAELRR